MANYYVCVLVKDEPDPVFDWVRANIPAEQIIRQSARPVPYERMMPGARPPEERAWECSQGWVVKVVVRSRESAEQVIEAWKSRAGRVTPRPLE